MLYQLKKISRLLLSLLIISIFYQCETTNYVYQEEIPQFVQKLSADQVSDTSILMTFKTNLSCNGQLIYQLNSDIDTVQIAEYRQEHEVLISGLFPYQNYQVSIELFEYFENSQLISDTITVKTNHNDFSKGWYQYNLGNFSEAILKFETFLDSSGLDLWSVSSLGWCYLQTGNFDKADEYFNNCYLLKPVEPINLLGLMVLTQMNNENNNVISYGKTLIDRYPQWNFIYNEKLNSNLARIILAETYLLQDQIDETISQINYFFENTIKINNSETWIVDNVKYDSIENFIIAAINFLKSEN